MTRLKATSGVTKPIPFDWKDFCRNEGTDCVPACFVMAARYWKQLLPDLPLPTDQQQWKDFISRTSARTSRGTSLLRLLRNLPTGEQIPDIEPPDLSLDLLQDEAEPEGTELEPVKLSNLVLDPRTPSSISELRSPFVDANPPIPQILVFDKMMMTRRIEGGSHAVMLLWLDFDKEKLYVVDPTLTTRMEPDIYDFDNFSRGWEVLSNLDILIYPEGVRVVSGADRSILEWVRRVVP